MPTKSTKNDKLDFFDLLFGNKKKSKDSIKDKEKKKKTTKSAKNTDNKTDKKKKLTKQKAGAITDWTFCVLLRDYIPNLFTDNFIEWRMLPPGFNVTIQKNTGIFGKVTYSMTDINRKMISLKMSEDEFSYFLMGHNSNFNSKFKLEEMGYYNSTPREENPDYHKNLCILYRIAFFENCIPNEFQDLYKNILEKIRNSFFLFRESKIKELEYIKRKKRNNREIKEKEQILLDYCLEPENTVMQVMENCYKKLKEFEEKEINICSIEKKDNYCKKLTINAFTGKVLNEKVNTNSMGYHI
jgi:hypothetical protein